MPQCLPFVREEAGGAYTLSYLMIMPLIIIICCLACETCLILMAKMGTVYAAFVGARTAAVQYSSNGEAEAQIEAAVVQAFTPFSSGLPRGADSTGDAAASDEYIAAYRAAFPDSSASENYLRRKNAYAESALTIEASGPPDALDGDVSVTVTYRYPFAFGIMGVALGGGWDGSAYSRPLSSTASLQNESPRNDEQSLGISYASP
jgi:hypothetical protein